jgi:putative membrane protein
VIVPVPDWPRFTHLWKLAYLGLNGVLVHPTAMLLFFARYPAYRTYELAPPIPGTSPLSDQQLAAGVMKLGSALVLVVAMGIIFASWVRVAERAANDDAR